MMEKENYIFWTREQIRFNLESLTKKQLFQQFGTYVPRFLLREEKWLKNQEAEVAEIVAQALKSLTARNPNKTTMLNIYCVPFLSTACFQRFLTYLPEAVQKALASLLLNGPAHYRELEALGIKAHVEGERNPWDKRGVKEPHPDLKFFLSNHDSSQYSYYYYRTELTYFLSTGLRELILPLFFTEIPYILPYQQEENTLKEISFESLIQQELPALLIRAQQKPIKLSQKGKPLASTIKSISKKQEVKEFHPDTEQDQLRFLRSTALVGLLGQIDEPRLRSDLPVLIKELFAGGLIENYNVGIHMFGHIKNTGRLDYFEVQDCWDAYFTIFKQLPQGEWMDYRSLEITLKSQLFSVSPFSEYGMHKLHIETEKRLDDIFERRIFEVHPYWKEKLIVWPAFRAAIFSMAAWGLIDLKYEEPDLSSLPFSSHSPFDGIHALKLNALGAYVLGLEKSYSSSVKAVFTLELADDSLSILLKDGDFDRASTAIKSFARPVGKQRFYTDAKLFLGDCKNPTDLDQKISIFSSIFSDNLPQNWSSFFKEISQKVDPLAQENSFSIFRIDPENQNLLKLIARDPQLKRLCLKAEGFMILIAKKDIASFRKRLQEYGYLLK
ncbi:MAG: hypothetical protein AAF696_18915 [Bacteroidota bacterium]